MVYTKDIKAYIVPVKTEDGSTVEIKAVMIGIVRWFKGRHMENAYYPETADSVVGKGLRIVCCWCSGMCCICCCARGITVACVLCLASASPGAVYSCSCCCGRRNQNPRTH